MKTRAIFADLPVEARALARPARGESAATLMSAHAIFELKPGQSLDYRLLPVGRTDLAPCVLAVTRCAHGSAPELELQLAGPDGRREQRRVALEGGYLPIAKALRAQLEALAAWPAGVEFELAPRVIAPPAHELERPAAHA